ncbi:MAG: hypothetical protein GXO39_07020 [Thermotogae bacterium]|nr:hypothetical protein [Thermotogota bacterium]
MVRKVAPTLILGFILLGCKDKEEGGTDTPLPNPVVVEQVTNYMCVPCKGSAEIIDSLDEAYDDKVVVVRYHVNDPYTGDPLYSPYSDSLLNFYGLNTSEGVPITVIGGDYREHGYDDTKRDDYAQKWFNVMQERSQIEPKYHPTVSSLMGDSLVVIDVSTSSKASSDVVRTLLTEYDAPLPPSAVKDHSNYVVRAGINSSHAEFVLDSAWNDNNLFVTVIINSYDGKVVGSYQGKVETYTLENLSNDGDTIAPLEEYTMVYLRMKSKSGRDLPLTFRLEGIPRDWNNTICWGVCLSDTNAVSNTLEAGSTTPDHGMYFSVYPTTIDTADITVKVHLQDDPRVFRQLKVRIISQ